MTTGHSPSSGDYDATTALSRFASPQDLERIAETRPDLHSILATNPSLPPRAREILERSDDAVVQEVLARQAGRGAQPVQPAQPPVPGELSPMAPTMAVGTEGAPPQQPTPAGSGYTQVPQGYGGHQPGAPGTAPQRASLQGPAPQWNGSTAPQSPQGPLPQNTQGAQPVAPPPASQAYSAPSLQSAAQPVDQQTAMPPGVPSRVPSGYGTGQAYDPGQAYGPSQPAAPAYGAPTMYAPPAQAPRKHRLLKVVAVVLPVILVLGVGGVAAWYFLWRSEVYLASPYVTPSDAWANGADKAWSADVKADEDPYVFGDHFLTLNRTDGTLTAYSPLGSDMKEVWQTTIDDDELSSSPEYFATFQAWGDNTLVNKSTVIDLKTGKTSKAPWGSSSALIVGDTAISCKESDKCTAWGANKKQKWSHTIAGTGRTSEISETYNGTFLTKGSQRYLALFNAIINIDSGETIFLGGGSKADSDLITWYFQDGWGTLELEEDPDFDSSSPSTRKYKVTVYDFKGKEQDSYQETLPAREVAVEEDKKLPTAEQHRSYFKDQDFSNVSLTARSNNYGCITELKSKQGSSIDVPDADTSTISSGCPSVAKSSQDGRVVKLMTLGRGDANRISALMNVKTGEEIKFSGISAKNGNSLIIAKPDLVIGYDEDAGKVVGFKPAS